MIDQPTPAPVPVYERCDEASAVVTKVAEGDQIMILSSMAGGRQTCYKLRLVRDGKTTAGYLIGPAVPAAQHFEASRQSDLREGRFVMPAAPPAPAPAPAPVAVPAEKVKADESKEAKPTKAKPEKPPDLS